MSALPVTLPVKFPENAVAVTVPLTSSFVDGVPVPIPILPELSIRILSVNALPLFVENIKSPLVSSAVPSWLPWTSANVLSAWSVKEIFDSQPPSVFSAVLFFNIKYGWEPVK